VLGVLVTGETDSPSTTSRLCYYIRLYFTVFLFARSNTHDIPFSNILISKKQFLCNKYNKWGRRGRDRMVKYSAKCIATCKKNPYIINQNHIFSKNYCEVISG
jgi:hypothetical protein